MEQSTFVYLMNAILDKDFEGAMNAIDKCTFEEINSQNQFGETPLYLATAMNIEPLVALLIKCDANPFITDKHGRKPIDICTNLNIMKMLKKEMDKITNKEMASITEDLKSTEIKTNDIKSPDA